MKRITLACLILALIPMTATAEVISWHTANQVTVGWDAVTTNVDGEPVTGTIEYAVFIAAQDKADPVQLWRGADTSTVLTLTVQGHFLLGIKSYLMVDGQQTAESDYGWTDDPEIVAGGNTFGLMFFKAPARVTGLNLQ
jgi:hypothetical protein